MFTKQINFVHKQTFVQNGWLTKQNGIFKPLKPSEVPFPYVPEQSSRT